MSTSFHHNTIPPWEKLHECRMQGVPSVGIYMKILPYDFKMANQQKIVEIKIILDGEY